MLTEDGVLDGAFRVVQVDQQLPVQELDAALVGVFPLEALHAPQPGEQRGSSRHPHIVGDIIEALQELCEEEAGVRPRYEDSWL